MRVIDIEESVFGNKDYEISVPEIKTDKEFYSLAYDIAGIGTVDRIECMGYLDMDTHENFITFKSRDEFRKNIAEVKRIETDCITVFFVENKGWNSVKVAFGNASHVYATGNDVFLNSVLALLKKRFGN